MFKKTIAAVIIVVLAFGGFSYSFGGNSPSDTFGGGDCNVSFQSAAAGMSYALQANHSKNEREIRHSTADIENLILLFAAFTDAVSCKKPAEGFKLFWEFSPVNVKK